MRLVSFGEDSADIDHNPYVRHLSSWSVDNNSNWQITTGEVASVSFLAEASYYIINDTLKLTYEHHVLIKRGLDQKYVFVRAENIIAGDYLIREDFTEEIISSVIYQNEDILSVCIDTEPFNMFIAGGGYVVHNEGPGGPGDPGDEHTQVETNTLGTKWTAGR